MNFCLVLVLGLLLTHQVQAFSLNGMSSLMKTVLRQSNPQLYNSLMQLQSTQSKYNSIQSQGGYVEYIKNQELNKAKLQFEREKQKLLCTWDCYDEIPASGINICPDMKKRGQCEENAFLKLDTCRYTCRGCTRCTGIRPSSSYSSSSSTSTSSSSTSSSSSSNFKESGSNSLFGGGPNKRPGGFKRPGKQEEKQEEKQQEKQEESEKTEERAKNVEATNEEATSGEATNEEATNKEATNEGATSEEATTVTNGTATETASTNATATNETATAKVVCTNVTIPCKDNRRWGCGSWYLSNCEVERVQLACQSTCGLCEVKEVCEEVTEEGERTKKVEECDPACVADTSDSCSAWMATKINWCGDFWTSMSRKRACQASCKNCIPCSN